MRKFFSIILLSIHLFNFGGYSLLFQIFIQQSDKQLIQKLDNHSYSKDDLVEVKVPLNLPYQTNRNYERFDGNIKFGGMHYNYVMRKVCNDTLYILCIPNHQKTQICNAQSNYQQLATDIPSNKKANDTTLKKIGIADEYSLPPQTCFTINSTVVKKEKIITASSLSDGIIETGDRPPEA